MCLKNLNVVLGHGLNVVFKVFLHDCNINRALPIYTSCEDFAWGLIWGSCYDEIRLMFQFQSLTS